MPTRKMRQRTLHRPTHCWLFKCAWRGTALTLRIEAADLEYAYKKAERSVLRMLGGSSCLSIECTKQVY